MIILAVYYTLADIVLLCQCFYYRGFTLADTPTKDIGNNGNGVQDAERGGGDAEGIVAATERTALLSENGLSEAERSRSRDTEHSLQARRPSMASFRERLSSVDGTHLSPATPLRDPPKPQSSTAARAIKPTSTLQKILLNAFAIALVCAAGVLGWYISVRSTPSSKSYPDDEPSPSKAPLTFDVWGQIFGYFCAVLYLGSRLPQLLLNYRRKSTEGVSLLFFLFACIGNLTYVFSILAYSPVCEKPGHCQDGEQGRVYARYMLVNASWLLGSFGTLLEDMAIFTQFFLYRENCYDSEEEVVDE